MNPKLENIRDEAWENYKEKNPPKGQASLYYKDNAEYWKAGFNAAEPHIRQDERERILDILNEYSNYIKKCSVFRKTPINADFWLESKLKKMDEVRE